MNLTASTLKKAWSVTLLSRVLKIPPLTGDENFFHGHTRLIAKWEWLRCFLPARLYHFEIDFDVKGMKPYREKGGGSKRGRRTAIGLLVFTSSVRKIRRRLLVDHRLIFWVLWLGDPPFPMDFRRFIFPVVSIIASSRARAFTVLIVKERVHTRLPRRAPARPLTSSPVIYTVAFKHTRLDLSACKWATFLGPRWILEPVDPIDRFRMPRIDHSNVNSILDVFASRNQSIFAIPYVSAYVSAPIL